MSGDMQYRVNRYWTNITQPNVSAFRFFWEVLQYVKDHPGLDFVAYGTGAVQTGTNPITAWNTWATPPPMSDNAWFVFRATNASANLGGGGTRPWQAKLQVFNSSSGLGIDDPSGNNYGNEGAYQCVVCRFSPDGGWAGPGTLDFLPPSGAAVDGNQQCFYDQNIDFGLHMVGDDDTIIIMGWGGDVPLKTIPKLVYLGETVRSRTAITKPEFACIGRIGEISYSGGDVGDYLLRRGTSTYPNFGVGVTIRWPSFALRTDGLTAHSGSNKFMLNGFVSTHQHDLSYDPWTNKAELADYVLSYYAPPAYSIIGDLRFVKTCGNAWGAGALLPDGKWMQVGLGSEVSAYGGIVIPWPEGVVPAW